MDRSRKEAACAEIIKFAREVDLITLITPNQYMCIGVFQGRKANTFDVISAFTIGNKWAASCDAQGVDAAQAFAKIAMRANP